MKTTARTKLELEQAVKQGSETIVVEGVLADKVHRSRAIRGVGSVTLGALIAALATAPATGGLSMCAMMPLAMVSGLSVSVIVVLVALGILLVLRIWKTYEEASYVRAQRLVLRRKGA